MGAAQELPALRVFTRPGCHLCEVLVEQLDALRAMHPHQLEIVDVDTRGEWRLRYGRRIPVLVDEQGRLLAEGVCELQALADALARSQTSDRARRARAGG